MHFNGINMRYLGIVVDCVKDAQQRELVIREIVARAFKSILFQKIREHVYRGLSLVKVLENDISGKIQAIIDKDRDTWHGLNRCVK